MNCTKLKNNIIYCLCFVANVLLLIFKLLLLLLYFINIVFIPKSIRILLHFSSTTLFFFFLVMILNVFCISVLMLRRFYVVSICVATHRTGKPTRVLKDLMSTRVELFLATFISFHSHRYFFFLIFLYFCLFAAVFFPISNNDCQRHFMCSRFLCLCLLSAVTLS